ncbi:Prostaglandin reductase 1 [Mortierella alpina]|nr:Prostaglandin reductase 1 [Mortierella alpina]
MTLAKQVTTTRVLVAQIPEGVAPNKSHFRTITVNEAVPELKDGAIYIQNLVFSLDPYIKFDFAEGATESPVVGFAIAKVLDSKNEKFPIGSTVSGPAKWESFTLIDNPEKLAEVFNLDKALDPELPLSIYNGVLGLSGLTVWDSLNQVGDLKKGETIYISSAAGTLGQLAGQLAKRKGLRVIGSAGTDEKVAFLKNELKFDAAFNYKTQDKRAALTEAMGTAGIDIYYDITLDDNVDIALDLLNHHGRIVSVGALALHQGQAPAAPANVVNILMKQLRYEGYLVYYRYDQFEPFWKEVAPLVKSGEIKSAETVLQGGIDSIADSYIRLLNGEFKGKVSVDIRTA